MKVLFVTLSVVVADQVTKLLVRGVQIPALGIHIQGMELYSSEPVIGNFLRFTYIQNPGMAFGINVGWKSFFAIFSIIASIAIFLYLYKVRDESKPVRFSLALILGGAIGNLIDRVFYGPLFEGTPIFHGRVVDFIDFKFFDIHFLDYNLSRFPVFNIADASVTVGVIMLLFFHVKRGKSLAIETSYDNAATGSDPGNSDGSRPVETTDPDGGSDRHAGSSGS